MLDKNPTRIDLLEKFNQIVDKYNLGAHSAEEFFEQLQLFIDELDEEGRRAAREGLVEPELTIFDLMCQGVELAEKERNDVKAIAKELLSSLKDRLVIGWRGKQQTKARVQVLIDDMLQKLPDSYDDNTWQLVYDKVYLHVYDKYPCAQVLIGA